MPDKMLQNDSSFISHYVGLIGVGISFVGGIGGFIVRWFLKKKEKLEDELEKQKASEELAHRESIEKSLESIWKRVDEMKLTLTEHGEKLAALGGRFEDLQLAHLKMTCEGMRKGAKE